MQRGAAIFASSLPDVQQAAGAMLSRIEAGNSITGSDTAKAWHPQVIRAAVLTAGLLAWAAPAHGAVEQVERKGDAIARVQLDRDAIELSGGAVVLTVSVEGKAPLEVEPIKNVTTAKEWLVTPKAEPKTETLPRGRMRWEQSFQLTPLQRNEVPLKLEPFRFRAAGEDSGVITWKPFTVKVSTVVASPSMSSLKDITPPEAVPEPVPYPWWQLAGGLGAVVGLVLLLVLLRRRGRRPAPPPVELPPEAWVLQELQRLEAQAPDAADQVERYHTLLSDVVRRYLDRRFSVRAAELTTREFLAALTQSAQLPSSQHDQLRAFFDRCDLAKYARAGYSPEECRVAVQLARDFVQHHAAALATQTHAGTNGAAHTGT